MNEIALNDRITAGNKIRLIRMPGNKVISENMTFSIAAVKKHGGKETVMKVLKDAMMSQFNLAEKDVAVLEVIDVTKPDTAYLSCLAYLDGNREPTTERDAMSYYMGHAAAATGEPDFIEI